MVRFGFSPCPNDTFIFYALANKRIDTQGLDFAFHIDDVETLNRLALDRALDATKISCHAFCYLQKEYDFLGTGGALGRGCGPLLVAKNPRLCMQSTLHTEPKQFLKIAVPGMLTTATLLLKLYYASSLDAELISMPFHKIMHAVREGIVDAGLIIHESRFTYPDFGLVKIIDLGEWWEKETGLPIPLGGIAARKSLGTQIIKTIENLIRTSINYSLAHKDEVIPYIKRYAQEMNEDVMMKHIALYVNEYTLDMGEAGYAALNELLKRANKIEEARG